MPCHDGRESQLHYNEHDAITASNLKLMSRVKELADKIKSLEHQNKELGTMRDQLVADTMNLQSKVEELESANETIIGASNSKSEKIEKLVMELEASKIARVQHYEYKISVLESEKCELLSNFERKKDKLEALNFCFKNVEAETVELKERLDNVTSLACYAIGSYIYGRDNRISEKDVKCLNWYEEHKQVDFENLYSQLTKLLNHDFSEMPKHVFDNIVDTIDNLVEDIE